MVVRTTVLGLAVVREVKVDSRWRWSSVRKTVKIGSKR